MKSILRVISRSFKKNPVDTKLLGRWSVVSENEAFQKADLQTEDHCGVCSDKRQVYLEEIKKPLVYFLLF